MKFCYWSTGEFYWYSTVICAYWIVRFFFLPLTYILTVNRWNVLSNETVKDAVQCTDVATCFIWTAVYQNISALIKDLYMEIYRARIDWTDKNNRPILCEPECSVVRILDLVMVVKEGTPFFNL